MSYEMSSNLIAWVKSALDLSFSKQFFIVCIGFSLAECVENNQINMKMKIYMYLIYNFLCHIHVTNSDK